MGVNFLSRIFSTPRVILILRKLKVTQLMWSDRSNKKIIKKSHVVLGMNENGWLDLGATPRSRSPRKLLKWLLKICARIQARLLAIVEGGEKCGGRFGFAAGRRLPFYFSPNFTGSWAWSISYKLKSTWMFFKTLWFDMKQLLLYFSVISPRRWYRLRVLNRKVQKVVECFSPHSLR
jgi:hypothetical protein